MAWPVMRLQSELARKWASAATSPGWPTWISKWLKNCRRAHLRAAVLVIVKSRVNRSRANAVDADVPIGQLKRGDTGATFQCGLRCAVSSETKYAARAGI